MGLKSRQKRRNTVFCYVLLFLLILGSYGSNKFITIDFVGLYSINAEDLGEFIRGNDTIEIEGVLKYYNGTGYEPIPDAKIYLYVNYTSNESYLIADNTTDSLGHFVFKIFIDNEYPLGEIYFTVIYPGDIFRGYAPARYYYKAVIVAPTVNSEDSGIGGIVIAFLLIMLVIGLAMTLRQLKISRSRVSKVQRWREVLDEMIDKVSRKEFGFVLLIKELVDSICKKYGVLPRVDMTLQQRLYMVKDMISAEVFNILKNLVSMYELAVYGGPYARTVIMNTIDFDTWKELLERVRKELT